jgi:hypothetical protein
MMMFKTWGYIVKHFKFRLLFEMLKQSSADDGPSSTIYIRLQAWSLYEEFVYPFRQPCVTADWLLNQFLPAPCSLRKFLLPL